MIGPGDPFGQARTGEPLRIPAAAYNAFLAAAKAHARVGASGPGVDTPLEYDVIVHNDTEDDLNQFEVLALGTPLTTPETRITGFLNGNTAFEGSIPLLENRGRFAILQEPCRAGGFARALMKGLTLARVKLLAPVTVDDDFADIEEGVTLTLQGAGSGSARLLWVEPHADRVDPNVPWCVVRLGDADPGGDFSVRITVDGGSAGDDETTCSWTYTVKTLRGKTIGEDMSPLAHRVPEVTYVETPEDSRGIAFYDTDGTLQLLWANEQPFYDECDTEPGFVVLFPTETAENTIVSQNPETAALTLIAADGQTAPMLHLQNHLGTTMFSFRVDGFDMAGPGTIDGILSLKGSTRYYDAVGLNYIEITAPGNLSSVNYTQNLIAATGNIAPDLEASPAAIGADQNNFALSNARTVRITASAATYKITGFAGGWGGRELYIRNVGSNPIRFTDEDANSTAANRLILRDGLPWMVIRPGDVYCFIYDDTTDRWVYQSGGDGWMNDPNYCFQVHEEFVGGQISTTGQIGELGWLTAGNGTSSITNWTGESNVYGARILRTGVNDTARSLTLMGPTAPNQRGGTNIIEWSAAVKLSALSTSAQEYIAVCGASAYPNAFIQNIEANLNVHVGFQYDRATNGDFWEAVTGTGAGTTVTTTAAAATTNWVLLRFVWDTAAGSVKFYINGTLVATHTTNIPATTDTFSMALFDIEKVVGTTQRDFAVDWCSVKVYRHAGRI